MIDEGYIKFSIDWTPAPALEYAEIRSLNRWRAPLHDAGLIGHYAAIDVGYGNISVRLDGGNQFIISGTQTGHIARTGPEHYALVTKFDVDANHVACRGPVKASSESMTHAAIYALDPTVNAIVHVHHEKTWAERMHELPTTLDDVAYGTPAMAHEFERLYAETDFAACGLAVMSGHEAGLISTGRNMREAALRILGLCATDLQITDTP